MPTVEVSLLFSSDLEFECPVNESDAHLHFAALGGGSLLDPYYLTPYRAVVEATGATPFFFGSGFQELSPLPAPTLDHLLRSSFPIHMRTETLEFPPWFDTTFSNLLRHFSDGSTRVFGGIRGFATQRLLHYIGRAGGLPVLYDPGLLLHQLFFSPCRESLQPLLPAGFSLAEPFVIVNSLDVKDDPYFRGALVPAVVQVTGDLACEFQVLVQSLAMYDMWLTREFVDAVRRAVPARCGEAARARIFLSPFTTEYLAVTELYRLAAFSINVKLHANVLAAATARPFIALGSRLKYMDFTETVHMSPLTFNYHDGISAQQLEEAVGRMRRQYAHIKAELVSSIADGMERHHRAFAEFVRHLFTRHPEVARALRRSSKLRAKVVVFRSKRVIIDITGSD